MSVSFHAKTAHNPGRWIYAEGYTLNTYYSMFLIKKNAWHVTGFTQFTPHVLTYIICFSGKNSKVFLHKNIIVYTCIICTKHPFSAGEAVSRSACFMLHLIEDAGPSYDLPAHIADML